MSTSARPQPRRIAQTLARSMLAGTLLVILAIMIVRDMVRRWGTERPPQSDVTQRSH